MSNQRFHNKVVLVTGGNSGIGLVTAKAFAEEGANIIISGRNPKTLDSAIKDKRYWFKRTGNSSRCISGFSN
ncbi:MAG: SDR family NAD(P)-dependent oxidoreductase [Nostoc sp.]